MRNNFDITLTTRMGIGDKPLLDMPVWCIWVTVSAACFLGGYFGCLIVAFDPSTAAWGVVVMLALLTGYVSFLLLAWGHHVQKWWKK